MKHTGKVHLGLEEEITNGMERTCSLMQGNKAIRVSRGVTRRDCDNSREIELNS